MYYFGIKGEFMGLAVKQIEIAKEMDDALALLEGVIKDAKAGKPVAEIATGNLQAFVEAIAGVDQIPAEASESRRAFLQTLGYRIGSIADAFLG